MGIHGLWPLLESSAEAVSLESLEGKRVAVDVSFWLYQARLGFKPDAACPHIHLLVNRLAKLIFYRIRPVFIFDGPNVPAFKRVVLEQRRMALHAEDLLVTQEKMKKLEPLAKNEKNVEEVVESFRSPKKKKRNEDDEKLFELPSTSKDTVELSASDRRWRIEEEEPRTMSNVWELESYRETLRSRRLHPNEIPSDSKEFSSFQLMRLLQRGRVNERIAELKKTESGIGEKMRLEFTEGDRTHILTYTDTGSQAVEEENKKKVDMHNVNRIQLTLEHLRQTSNPLRSRGSPMRMKSQAEEDEEQDLERAISESLKDVQSKSDVVEELMRNRKHREDDWSPPPPPPTGEVDEYMSDGSDDSSEIQDEEWNPGRDDEGIGERPMTELKPVEESLIREYRELQEFLTAAGFPWIESPGEAEAQCVFLEGASLVDAVVSDDSDCFAFGAKKIIRHMFSREKDIQFYRMDDIQENIGLSRWDVVSIAMLSGGDYSKGLKGVGIVTALQLMAEFTEKKKAEDDDEEKAEMFARLVRIEEWLLEEGEGGGVHPEPTAIRRKLRTVVERNNTKEQIRGLANADILAAYSSPEVDDSLEVFRWRIVDTNKVKNLLWKNLAWDEKKCERTVMDAFRRWNEHMEGKRSYQKHLTSYLEGKKKGGGKTSKKIEAALKIIKNGNIPPVPLIPPDLPPVSAPSSTVGRPVRTRPSKRTLRKRKQPTPAKDLNLSDDSWSDD